MKGSGKTSVRPFRITVSRASLSPPLSPLLSPALLSKGEINIPLDMLNDDYNDLEIEYPISPSSVEDATTGEGKKKKTRGETPNINPNAAPPKPGKFSVVLRHTALGE